jgi:hypothetical protein
MEKYWTGIVRKLIPELTRDTCYLVSLYLNVSDVYLLIETPGKTGKTPTERLELQNRFTPNYEIYHSYAVNGESRVNLYLKRCFGKSLQIYTPYLRQSILSNYKLEDIPANEMRNVSGLCFDDVKKLKPECVALYFHFNRHFYNLTADDWQWIYDTCKNAQYFNKHILHPICHKGAVQALKLGFIFANYLYSDSIVANKNGERSFPIMTEDFLEILLKHTPLTYENNSIYNCIRNLWIFRRVHTKIKIWKKKCLEIAFAYCCQETIQILHSKGLKTNKACIIQALYRGNIRALEYKKKYIERNFKSLELLRYMFHKHTLVWILDNFPIDPCSFTRNNNMSKEILTEFRARGFEITIKISTGYRGEPL